MTVSLSHSAMVAARFLVGIFAGLATGVCPMYTIEISPKNLRGIVGVLCQLFITIGILSAQIIAFPQLMGKQELWGWLMVNGFEKLVQISL